MKPKLKFPPNPAAAFERQSRRGRSFITSIAARLRCSICQPSKLPTREVA